MSLIATAYHQDGKTCITARENDPSIFFICNATVDGDFSKASNNELVNLTLDWLTRKYITEYEAIKSSQKIEQLAQSISQYEALSEKANEKIKEMDKTLLENAQKMAEYATNSEMAQAIVLEIVGKLYEKGVLVDDEFSETV